MGLALTVEQFGQAFYTNSLNSASGNYTDDAFSQAGYNPAIRKRFTQILNNKNDHVNALLAVENLVGGCDYAL